MPAHATAQDAAAIEAVVLQQGYGAGYGGAITVADRPAMRFKDGRFTRDAAGALAPMPRIDGRWRRDGDGWQLVESDGKSTKVAATRRAIPAARGRVLEGRYASLSGVGTPGPGVAVVSAWRGLHFATDGTVRTGQGAGATGGGTTAASRTGEVARDRLDGDSIVIEHADGRRERQLFYLFPDSERVIGVGAATLTLRR